MSKAVVVVLRLAESAMDLVVLGSIPAYSVHFKVNMPFHNFIAVEKRTEEK